MLSKLIEYGKMEYKTAITYRIEFLSSIIITPVTLLMLYFVWTGIFRNTGDVILGYTFQEMMVYYVMTFVVGHFIYNTVGNDMQEAVIYGELNQILLKPIPVIAQFFSREAANRVFALITEVIPIFIIGAILFGIRLEPLNLIMFIPALLGSFVINFLLGYAFGILSFWMQKVESIQWLFFFGVRFFSGEFIPLDFFGPLLGIMKFLPFYYIRYGAINLALGKITGSEILYFYLAQIAWIVIIYVIIGAMWAAALRKYGAEGG